MSLSLTVASKVHNRSPWRSLGTVIPAANENDQGSSIVLRSITVLADER